MGRKIQSIGKYKFCYEMLGKGSFARVELVCHEVTKCKVAMKIINTRKITEDYVRNNLYREARILSQMNHPNIIKFYESLKADIYYCLVTECAQGGELSDYMKTFDDKRFPEDVARHYLRQLISAIQYMHERGVVHRDLKMENLLLDKTKRHLKLVDFGLSNNLPCNDLLSTHCGSPEYAAPELFINNSTYGPEVDIWSFGIVMYTCVTGQLPFFSPYYDHARRQRLSTIINKGLTQVHVKEMGHLTADCKSLIKDVLEPLPQIRLPLDEILNHLWITNQSKLSFTPFFPRSKLTEMKTQIVEKLAEMTNLKKIEVERFVHESATNELSAMFKMLLEDAKVEKGYYDEDHTNRPVTIVQERKRHIAQLKWKKLRYRLKESARVFREIINNRQSSNGIERGDLADQKEEELARKNEAKLKRLKLKKKVNPVGIVKTEKKKDFFPEKRSLIHQASSMEPNKSMSQLKLSRSRRSKKEATTNQNYAPVLSDPSPKTKHSPLLSQRKVTSNTPIVKPNSLSNSIKDVRNVVDKYTDDINLSSKQLNKATYRKNSKKVKAPVAPFANIDEVDTDYLETLSFLDEFEPRYCLIKVTDSSLSSGVMLSSTVSEISEGKSLVSSFQDKSINEMQNSLYDNQTVHSSETNTPTAYTPRVSMESQYICNGVIPSNDFNDDLQK